MALLAFDLPSSTNSTAGTGALALPAPPHVASLLSPSQKLKTAGELNAAILASQSQGSDPKLPQMLRMMAWGEDLLRTDTKVGDVPCLAIGEGLGMGRARE